MEKWHITLAFLGDGSPEKAESALRSMPTAPEPFTLRLAGGGCFGAAIWAGVQGDVPSLETLQSGVRSTLTAAGFAREDRPFQPHLTVSYSFDRRTAAALTDYTGPSWPVTSFTLVDSVNGDYRHLWSQPLPCDSRTADG